MQHASTPQPPYYAVIFTATASDDQEGYKEMVQRVHELAGKSAGFLGMESAGDTFEITVSYWKDEKSIALWKANSTHLTAQGLGRSKWYERYNVRIAKVERDYHFSK